MEENMHLTQIINFTLKMSLQLLIVTLLYNIILYYTLARNIIFKYHLFLCIPDFMGNLSK